MSQKLFTRQFLIGLGLGLVVGTVIVWSFMSYLYSGNIVGEWDDRLLYGDTISKYVDAIEIEKQLAADFVFGTVEAVDPQSVTVLVNLGTEVHPMTFTVLAGTRLYTVSNDEALTEVPITLADIQVGDEVTVTTEQELSSAETLVVTEIMKF